MEFEIFQCFSVFFPVPSIDTNLGRDVVSEFIADIRNLSKIFQQFNTTLSWTNFSNLLLTVCNTLNVFSMSIYRDIKVLPFILIISSAFWIILTFRESMVASRILKKFDYVYLKLLDKSIDTIYHPNNHRPGQKNNHLTISDGWKIFELNSFRRHYKSYYMFQLLPVNLNTFGDISLFIVNYIFIFGQTSIMINKT